MRIYLKVITRSSQQKVEKVSEGDYKIWINSVPEKGKANQEIINILANYFGVSKSEVAIIGGKTSSKKIIDIIPSPTNYYSPKS
jgi:uncharacterized protein (TIGR00251 family)